MNLLSMSRLQVYSYISLKMHAVFHHLYDDVCLLQPQSHGRKTPRSFSLWGVGQTLLKLTSAAFDKCLCSLVHLPSACLQPFFSSPEDQILLSDCASSLAVQVNGKQKEAQRHRHHVIHEQNFPAAFLNTWLCTEVCLSFRRISGCWTCQCEYFAVLMLSTCHPQVTLLISV